MIKVCYALQDEVTTKIWLTNAIELSEGLLKQIDSPLYRIQLQRKFASFGQFIIDDLIKSNKYQEAFQLIEERKNLNIYWLISSLSKFPTNNPTYEDIKTLLKPKTAILCWHLSPVHLTTFVIRDQQEDWVNLSSDSLRQLEDWLKIWKKDYQKFSAENAMKKERKPKTQEEKNKEKEEKTAQNSWEIQMSNRLEELKKILKINDILEQIKDIDHLIISPHRDLWLLPLGALFPENINITYQPSLKIALERKNQAVNFSKKDQILIIDDPTKDLEFSRLQGDIIIENYPKYQRISGETATKETVIKHLKKPKSQAPTQIKIEHLGKGLFQLKKPFNYILHYIGHGQHNFDSPGNSGLKLQDTILTVNDLSQEIDDLSHYQIGNIIGCETGVSGTEELINEFVSIGSIFYAKGVKNVISSLWEVEELATSLLMIKFYEILPTNNNISVALKQAQIWLKNSTKTDFETYIKGLQIEETGKTQMLYLIGEKSDKKPFNSPYYWAGFYAIM
jgi:CHAT domain-containing protein